MVASSSLAWAMVVGCIIIRLNAIHIFIFYILFFGKLAKTHSAQSSILFHLVLSFIKIAGAVGAVAVVVGDEAEAIVFSFVHFVGQFLANFSLHVRTMEYLNISCLLGDVIE